MKRAEQLVPLSREHHAALVLAKRIALCPDDQISRHAMCVHVSARFNLELAPHFEEEERWLLPALQAKHPDAVRRTLDDHRVMRELISRIANSEVSALNEFGLLLAHHVRFEERELFPLFESSLSVQLDAVTGLSSTTV